MSSFKPPMGESNTGNFDSPFGGGKFTPPAPKEEGTPFAPPVPPAPKAEGASFAPPAPKAEGASFAPPAPKAEGASFAPPAPKAEEESFTPSVPPKPERPHDEVKSEDTPKTNGRGKGGRTKSIRRVWPWLTAVAVVVVAAAGVLGYGYFANEGNNPVGEKLGFSHAKVTDQSTTDPNNGSYHSNSSGDDQLNKGQENSSGNQVPNPEATSRADSGSETLSDADYGKDYVDTIRNDTRKRQDLERVFKDYKVTYSPNKTAEEFVKEAGELTWRPISLQAVSDDTFRVEGRFSIPSSDWDKYDVMGNIEDTSAYPILALAYEAGVPDPKVDVAWYSKEDNSLVCELKGLSLKGKSTDYPFAIPGTDPELWKQVMFPDGYPEG